MIDLHVISDLALFMFEHTDPVDEVLPDCDLVIFAGNCGYVKRTMVYAEMLCNKYPDKQFIVNLGMKELPFQKNSTEIRDGLMVRHAHSELWPENLHFKYQKPIKLKIKDRELDILCMFGFPYIDENVQADEVWKSTEWYRYAYHGLTHNQNDFKPKGASDVNHGHFPIWSTPALCREYHDKELEIVKAWLGDGGADSKILITALSPIDDPCLSGIQYTMYSEIEPDHWIFGGSAIKTSKLYGNPGKGAACRSEVLCI
jgi:hypothetical protein